MSDTVKLIIEITKEAKQAFDIANDLKGGYYDYGGIIGNAIRNGIPLDKDSERAEVQAYFDGEAYGWKEGRKALLDDVKAEMEKHQFSREYCCDHNIDTAIDMGMVRIILDNIGKESEVKPSE